MAGGREHGTIGCLVFTWPVKLMARVSLGVVGIIDRSLVVNVFSFSLPTDKHVCLTYFHIAICMYMYIYVDYYIHLHMYTYATSMFAYTVAGRVCVRIHICAPVCCFGLVQWIYVYLLQARAS